MADGEFEYTQILDCRDGEVLVAWAPTWCKIGDVNNVGAAVWACPKPANLGARACAAKLAAPITANCGAAAGARGGAGRRGPGGGRDNATITHLCTTNGRR